MHTTFINFAIFYWHGQWCPKQLLQYERTPIQGHQNNIKIMKKFEIWRELPKCDTKTEVTKFC